MNEDLINKLMVVLSSPSGARKTTITKKIQQKYQSFKYQYLIQPESQDLTR